MSTLADEENVALSESNTAPATEEKNVEQQNGETEQRVESPQESSTVPIEQKQQQQQPHEIDPPQSNPTVVSAEEPAQPKLQQQETSPSTPMAKKELPANRPDDESEESSAAALAVISPPPKKSKRSSSPGDKNNNNSSSRRDEASASEFIFGHKQIARHHKAEQQELNRTNKAANASLRSIEEITTKTKKYSEVHSMIESLNREEEQLFVEIPTKIGKIKLTPAVQKPKNPASSSAHHSNGDEDDSAEKTFPYKIEPSAPPQKKKILTAADAGVQKKVPLPVRNIPAPNDVVSPSRFRNIAEPSENRKDLVREKKEKELEKCLVKPGQKCPPPAHGFVPERKPAKKVEKGFVPECQAKRPSHWPEPEKAVKKVTEPGMKFTTSPNKTTAPLLGGASNSTDAAEHVVDEGSTE